MVKARFTSLDVCAMVRSLRSTLLGYRISNVYDLNRKTYVLKLAKPDHPKLLLLIESGVRVHLTKYARDKGQIPSGFTIKLRKHVRSRRIEAVRQLGTDRVLVLTCGSGAAQHTLLIELYDRGNIVLLDSGGAVLTLLRNSKHDADARVTVGDVYSLEPSISVEKVSREWLVHRMSASEPRTTLRGVLLRAMPLGKELIEHVLCVSAAPPNLKMADKPWEDEATVDRLVDALRDAERYVWVEGAEIEGGESEGGEIEGGESNNEARTPCGVLLIEEGGEAVGAGEGSGAGGAGGARGEGGASGAGGGAGDGVGTECYTEFAPFDFAQYAGKRTRKYDDFNEAADEFFSRLEVRDESPG